MFTRGEFTTNNVTYGAIVSHTKACTEAVLITSGTVVSAYKATPEGTYSYNNVRAKELVQMLQTGIKGCNGKNATPAPFELGAMTQHEHVKQKTEYIIQLFRGEVVGAYAQSDSKRLELSYVEAATIPENIPYIKLTTASNDVEYKEDDLDNVPVRSVQEIALEKDDLTWIQNKKYYIVNDDETAEKVFTWLDNYNGVIAYDTETTGLHINCFGKIGSKYERELKEYNEKNPNSPIRADRLVGIIFCVEKDVSYYFPCFNRKFKNLYEDTSSPVRNRIISNIKARYTIGDLKDSYGDMKSYVLNTPAEEFRLDVILMERVRDILQTKHLVAHNGTFEWKVDWLFEIDTNLADDTMIMHQLMYKFRSTTSNRGEPSNLKYLAKRELGIDQWELVDFFPDWKADKTGTIRVKSGEKTKKASSRIDFSYMDYAGTQIYAPTDGDVTFQLYTLYKKDLIENHKEMEYIYSVELYVSCAIAYMEFYGHRLDESKIEQARQQTRANIQMIISEFRQIINYSNDAELDAYNKLKQLRGMIDSEKDKGKLEELKAELPSKTDALEKAIADNEDYVINLASPAQMAELFYDKLGIPAPAGKRSVAKNELKALLKDKDEDGKPKYPAVALYSKYKVEDTLMTKFFDNLIYFMYPGGLVFSSYGQIAAATGRMSCIEEHTPIKLVNGDKEIREVEKGDIVYCYDNVGNIKQREVKRVIDNGVRGCMVLEWKRGNDVGKITCTPDHKIYTANNRWVEAIELEIRDKVRGLHGDNEPGEIYTITNKYYIGNKHVYDLEVDEFHNFIAGEICVHNCSKPNAQQYPKVITKIVVPREGFIMMDADYSQIEYRVLTALAENEWLAQMFSDPDSDYHTLMASLMYGVPYESVTPQMRSAAKSFNFGIPYGMGLKSLAILLTGKSTKQAVDEAAEKYELYFANQPKTRKFFDNVKEMAKINGYTKTLFNRYRYYTFVSADGKVDNGKMAAALRQAGNAVIQGCLDGDTRIQTKELGIVKIKEAVGYSGDIWNGKEWTRGDVLYSGKKQKCIITFDNEQKFICSPIHKFLPVNGDACNEDTYIMCKDLKTGDSIQTNTNSELRVIGSEIRVKSVEITNEYIDMYDVCNTDCGYYVADGIITHNTAADIFKIGVARNFLYIRQNKLFGKLLIINMVHDEQLMEIDVQTLNPQRVLADVGKNMQFEIEKFPPLYIGAGIGPAWGYAKGKMAEIHPTLLAQLTEEAKSIPIYRQDTTEPVDTKEVLDYFQNRVYEFRRQKVADYLADPSHWNQNIHPAIGSLINLQFNYGRGDDAKSYKGPNGEVYSDQEFLELNIADFLKENNIQAEPTWFKANDTMQQQKDEDNEDSEYKDEDEDDEAVEASEEMGVFNLEDESDKLFGSSVQDIIRIFGACILAKQRICGLDVRDIYYKHLDILLDYLGKYVCESDDAGAHEIVFLKAGNILHNTGIYVKGLRSVDFENKYKSVLKVSKSVQVSDYTQGDVNNRSQAK